MTWIIYMIETKNGTFYTGITTDMERRFREHTLGKKGAKYFYINPPKEVVFKEERPDRSSATKRELEIKALTHSEKIKLKMSKVDKI